MVKPEQVAQGVMSYAEAEILPAMQGGQLWAGSAILILLSQRANQMVAALAKDKMFAMLGLVDENGMIDVDAAANALKETARKHGKLTVSLPMFGKFSFGEEDFDALREHITNAGK